MVKLTFLVLLVGVSPAAADVLERPDGCYQLGMLVPKAFDTLAANTVVPTGHDICMTSKKVQPEKDNIQAGDFEIAIRKGTTTLVTYRPKAMLIDASGSHYDYVFAAPDVLQNIGNPDAYARGNRGPIENTIFYILVNDTKQAKPVVRKSGDYAGTVTIGDVRYGLIVK